MFCFAECVRHIYFINATVLQHLYIDEMLNKLLLSGYGAKIYAIDVGYPKFADDIELVTLNPTEYVGHLL